MIFYDKSTRNTTQHNSLQNIYITNYVEVIGTDSF